METKQAFNLFGFIDYGLLPIGFVTPVFQEENGVKYVQNTRFNNRKITWELLPSEYIDIITPVTDDIHIRLDKIIYGFKDKQSIFFNSGEDMERYLIKSNLGKESDYEELIQGFIDEWKNLELDNSPITKEEVWEKCLEIISQESSKLPIIFYKNFSTINFDENVLTLRSSSDQLTKVFRNQYENYLVSIISIDIPNFKIEFTNSISDKIAVVPFVYFGGGEGHTLPNGSSIIETNINGYQRFDNFVVGDFNAAAYHSSLNFINKAHSTIFIIKGMNGIGKTHLINSMASRYCESFSSHKIGFFRVVNNPHGDEEFTSRDLDQFKYIADAKDIIVIDDLHKIKGSNKNIRLLIGILNSYSEQGKKIIISYDHNKNEFPFKQDFFKSTTKVEEVSITPPTEEDKLKIIQVQSSSHNFAFSYSDIQKISNNLNIKTVADIQHHILKALLSFEISTHKGFSGFINFNLPSHHNNPQWIEASVNNYIRVRGMEIDHVKPVEHTFNMLNIKVMSSFITGLFMESNNYNRFPSSNIELYGSYYYYSFDVMQNILLRDEKFRETLTDIVIDILNKKD